MKERGNGSLRLRGKVWWARYYLHGALVEKSTGATDPKRAQRFLKDRLAEVRTNTHGDLRSLKYQDLRTMYYDDYQLHARKSLYADADGNPRLDWVARLDSYFENWRTRDITTDAIVEYQKHEQARKLSNGTINRSVSALRRMFTLAVRAERISKAPYFPMLPESKPRSGYIDGAQFSKLMQVLPAYLRLPTALGFFTGMRLGEIQTREWTHVDLLHGVIRLDPGETKNGESRVVPVVPMLRQLLEAAYAKRGDCQLVCYRLDRKGHPRPLGTFRKAWQRATRAAGLEGLLFHDLRRSCTKALIDSGNDEKTAMKVTGHLTRAVFDRYHIVKEHDILKAGARLASHFENMDKAWTN